MATPSAAISVVAGLAVQVGLFLGYRLIQPSAPATPAPSAPPTGPVCAPCLPCEQGFSLTALLLACVGSVLVGVGLAVVLLACSGSRLQYAALASAGYVGWRVRDSQVSEQKPLLRQSPALEDSPQRPREERYSRPVPLTRRKTSRFDDDLD